MEHPVYPFLKYGIIVWRMGSHVERILVMEKHVLKTMIHMQYADSCRGMFLLTVEIESFNKSISLFIFFFSLRGKKLS